MLSDLFPEGNVLAKASNEVASLCVDLSSREGSRYSYVALWRVRMESPILADHFIFRAHVPCADTDGWYRLQNPPPDSAEWSR
jgi:hypothetical protein